MAGAPVDLGLPNLDHGGGAGPRVFEGIGNQVLEHLLQQRGVALDERQVGDFPFHLAALDLGLQHADHFRRPWN